MSARDPAPDLRALGADPRVTWTEDVLRFSDTDANGHINNAAFAVFCESGRVNLLHGTLDATAEENGYFVIAALAIVFRAELFYPGRVRCGTWFSRIGRSSIDYGQVLTDEAGRLVATSRATTVAMDPASRRPAPLGPAMRAAVESRLRGDAAAET